MPLALDTAYSYAVPPGLSLRDGDVVQVPLGTRETIGVVWSLREGAGSNLKPVTGLIDAAAPRAEAPAADRLDRLVHAGAEGRRAGAGAAPARSRARRDAADRGPCDRAGAAAPDAGAGAGDAGRPGRARPPEARARAGGKRRRRGDRQPRRRRRPRDRRPGAGAGRAPPGPGPWPRIAVAGPAPGRDRARCGGGDDRADASRRRGRRRHRWRCRQGAGDPARGGHGIGQDRGLFRGRRGGACARTCRA